jgi:hypothetical protein
MIKSLKAILVFALLTQVSAGQIISNSLINATDYGFTNNFFVSSNLNASFFTSFKRTRSNNISSIDSSTVHVYNLNFNNTPAVINHLPGSSDYPFQVFELNDRVWVGFWKGATYGLFHFSGSANIEFKRINGSLNAFDSTIYVTFIDSLHHVNCHVANGKLYVFAGIYEPNVSNSFYPPTSIQIKTFDSNFQVAHDTLLTHRDGFRLSGSLKDVYNLGNDEFAFSGIHMKAWQYGTDTIRQGFTDIGIYNRQYQLKFNDIILAEPSSTFPVFYNFRRRGPYINTGMARNPITGSYYYFGSHADTLDSFTGDPPMYGNQELYLAKINSAGQIVSRHYFGHPGRNDVPNQSYSQIQLAPNGRLYTCFAINFGAFFNTPDSIQTLVVYSVDTNFNNPEYLYWNDGSDIQSTAMIADQTGIYVLANSTLRGGEKFHVLRIDGTGWASSSRQPSLPQWQVYPNPTQGQLYLQGTTLPSKLILRDVQGKVVTQLQTPEDGFLTLSGVSSGMYFLHGSNENGEHWPVKKIVVR